MIPHARRQQQRRRGDRGRATAVRIDLVRDDRHVGRDVERVADAGAGDGARREAAGVTGTVRRRALRAAEEQDRDFAGRQARGRVVRAVRQRRSRAARDAREARDCEL